MSMQLQHHSSPGRCWPDGEFRERAATGAAGAVGESAAEELCQQTAAKTERSRSILPIFSLLISRQKSIEPPHPPPLLAPSFKLRSARDWFMQTKEKVVGDKRGCRRK
jgi:hypothetical protein